MEGKRGSECLLKPVSNIDFNPNCYKTNNKFGVAPLLIHESSSRNLIKKFSYFFFELNK